MRFSEVVSNRRDKREEEMDRLIYYEYINY
jgi:hypothetical protein